MKAIEVGAQAALLGALGTSWTPLGRAVPVAQAPSPGVRKHTLVDSLKCGPWSNLFKFHDHPHFICQATEISKAAVMRPQSAS